MEIVGNGFIAENLRPVTCRHPDAVVLAAGVSSTHVTDSREFARETVLTRDITRRCARDNRRLVVFSTASHALYGSRDDPVQEWEPIVPSSCYGRHKLALERLVAESGAPWLVLRLAHVAGTGQRPHQLLPALVTQIRSGTVRVHRGAHRDLVDVLDVVNVVDGLLASGSHGEVINVASGTPFPIETIADGIAARMGMAAQYEMVDAAPARTVVSVDRLRALLPSHAPCGGKAYLDRILDRYVPHYLDRGA